MAAVDRTRETLVVLKKDLSKLAGRLQPSIRDPAFVSWWMRVQLALPRALGRQHPITQRILAVEWEKPWTVGTRTFHFGELSDAAVYPCGFWPRPASAGYTVDDAQTAKLALICRKLGLAPGMRLLDLGCGWGSLVIHAARHHGVRAVGVTLSPAQAELARRRAAAAGVADRVEIRVQDYREVRDGPFDAVASVGMAEHVGAARLPGYARRIVAQLRPGGRLLHHAIARRPHGALRRSSFIDRYVFPDGELVPLGTMVGVLEDAELEVRDVEGLREHYTATLTARYQRLSEHWGKATALVGEQRARTWRLYLAGSAVAFDTDRLGVNQVLAVHTPPGQRSGLPATRDWMTA